MIEKESKNLCPASAHGRLGRRWGTSFPDLSTWAGEHGLDAAIWTALGSKFGTEERSPSVDEVIYYLHSLQGSIRDHARRYIGRAPRQIDTDFIEGG